LDLWDQKESKIYIYIICIYICIYMNTHIAAKEPCISIHKDVSEQKGRDYLLDSLPLDLWIQKINQNIHIYAHVYICIHISAKEPSGSLRLTSVWSLPSDLWVQKVNQNIHVYTQMLHMYTCRYISVTDPQGTFADIYIYMYTCVYICIFWFTFLDSHVSQDAAHAHMYIYICTRANMYIYICKRALIILPTHGCKHTAAHTLQHSPSTHPTTHPTTHTYLYYSLPFDLDRWAWRSKESYIPTKEPHTSQKSLKYPQESLMYDMTFQGDKAHSYVWHDSIKCVKRCVLVRDNPVPESDTIFPWMWHDWFSCMPSEYVWKYIKEPHISIKEP